MGIENLFSDTLIIIVITVVLSLMAFQNRDLRDDLIFYTPAIHQGQMYRFISHGFIHADFNHLLFNMFTLYFFGNYLEGLFSHYLWGTGFYVFYLIGIIVAMIPTYWQNRSNPHYACLGASGAVSAVLFAFILINPWSMLGIFGIVPIPAIVFGGLYVAYSIYAGKRMNDNVNHSAHLWGGAYGVAVTIMANPFLFLDFFTKLLNP